MQTNILDYLEKTLSWLPEKTAFADDSTRMTYRRLWEEAGSVGSFLWSQGLSRKGVVLFLHRSPRMAAAFFGTAASGNYAVVLEETLPENHLAQILSQVDPRIILCDEITAPCLENTEYGERCCCYESVCREPADGEILGKIRRASRSEDPLYAVFAPGADGKPRGMVVSHGAAIERTDALGAALHCSSNTVLADYPLFWQEGWIRNLLLTVKYGASCCMVTRGWAASPLRLLEILEEYRVNTLCWSASALGTLSDLSTFGRGGLGVLQTIASFGERMPHRQLQLWRRALPGGRIFRLYTPGEGAGVCCIREMTEVKNQEETPSAGFPLPNAGILLLDDRGWEAKAGEICIRGSFLALGCFRNAGENRQLFPENPANPDFPERIYRTGDYGTWSEQGELILLGRRDGRIRFQGGQLELGAIEAAAGEHPGVDSACCQFEEKSGALQLFYTGDCTCQDMITFLRARIPRSLLPRCLYLLKIMPMTPGGAIDRSLLRKNSRKGLYAYEALGKNAS